MNEDLEAMDALCAKIIDQRDRIDALEAALRSLLKEPPSILDDPDTDAQIVIRMRKIASAALAYPEPHYVDPANACDDRSIIEAKSQAALAQERERCIAICESWIGTFQKFELKHTSPRDYAVDAIGDIIEVIRDGADPRAALDKDAGQ